MLRIRSVLTLFAFGFLLAAANSQAATITSVDRAAFAAAVVGGTIGSQDFDGIAAGTLLTTTPDVTYSASGGTPIVTANFLTTTPPNGLGSTSIGFFNDEIATFVFTMPITAFAIDINTFAEADGAYSATLNTGDVVLSLFEVFPGQITGQFIGFVSDTPFSSVSISQNDAFTFTLDTLVYGDAATVVVPLPGALLLLLSALPIFRLIGRRKS